LSLLEQYHIDAMPAVTGGHPGTLTMAMSGQIDIGRGAAPFGLELVEKGDIRIIARGSEIKSRADQTVRICVTNLQTLAKKDTVAHYMQGYRDAIDFMYANGDALIFYEEFAKVPARLMREWRDEFFPKNTMWPDEVKGLDLILADALKNKFVAYHLERRMASVRSTISAGTLAVSSMSFCNSSPEAG
jgi:NitT/TauT family transport system substrate-binding protein